MRAAILGDIAAGKSTFAVELGAITEVPVTHLDSVMNNLGRQNRAALSDFIKEVVDEPAWIIDGNAFGEDPSLRIAEADKIFVFDIGRLHSLTSHVARHRRLWRGEEIGLGGVDIELRLGYYLPYILKKCPEGKKAALELATSLEKDITIFKNKREVSNYLASVAVGRLPFPLANNA